MPKIVRVGEPATDLAADVGDQLRPRRAERLPDRAHRLGQVVAADVLHRDEVLALDRAQLEDVDDVGMVEARGQLRLLDEHLDERRVIGEVGENPFDDEHAFEAGRALDASLVHLRHTASSDALEQRVLAELNRLRELCCHGQNF